ncbi:uncharacterized protein LOC126821736 [Patella vulgata]|uniref:uncharacterized protein LOC126821736 n=1 Tax=Patella vulgata TaxID=6465 RepID=UPI00217F9501|nr:uncharacterized protein LOC126821736 [Patella vulgata]
MAEHKKILIAVMIITVVIFIITLAFNGASGVGPPLFKNNTGALSDKYSTGITPSGWVFSIWGVIYTWQCLWLLFAFINIFRKTADGPAYVSPMILTPLFFIVYTFNLCFNTSWIFLFGNEHIVIAFVALFLIAFCLYICMFIAYRNLYQNGPRLQKQGRNIEIWMHRLLVHNGLGIYATWTTIATLLNVVMTMVYGATPGVGKEDAGTVALGLLTAELAIFIVSDLVFLDNYSRYTVTPYMVVCIALGGSIDKNWDQTKTNSIFSAVLLAIGCTFLVVKIIVMIWRHIKKPLYPTEIAPTTAGIKA